ncbi:NLI interacting factor-like phosphatase-domain-containing protein [Diplogelasinospora grovesii]|uniref:NLI interacting factor-like phosphatase-domain-containing protein n=1 Tax=Diplogelasinospora grovesii TaxID=303347 RepID=A0AAN6NDK0_9PEZI|nr:NLI interacting factor-like phosphatase-domain-containing protein [Diplogelasinospora grovesii]
MNSLNIISARVSPPSSPAPTRTNSLSTIGLAAVTSEGDALPRENESALGFSEKDKLTGESEEFAVENHPTYERNDYAIDESTPLLSQTETKETSPRSYHWSTLPKRIATTFINSIRWVLSTLAAPGVYLIACFYDEHGNFAPLFQLRKLFGMYGGNARKMAEDYHEGVAVSEKGQLGLEGIDSEADNSGPTHSRRLASGSFSSSGLSSESESDPDPARRGQGSSRGTSARHHTRSRSLPDDEEIAPARRSIRIKLHAEDALRQRKHRKAKSASVRGGNASSGSSPNDISAQLKSPTSPVGALTRYPKTPAPPRPLIPRRQPSYINADPASIKHQKTLILDLDETLIHSMSKGGRMSTGHMVEVRLATTYVGVGGQASIGPQHPILYYVHKRPHCDDFLRRVSKWFNLVVFTASVQEYADPVIDWLESDRKYFSARYYRQHCTFRHGAFIKDLSSVEPDLSKVMILDNSPLSYMFHQDNAIPIQGWISDPTDNDLMYLIPFLEGLQYVSDVRALLALRGGEDGQHMA